MVLKLYGTPFSPSSRCVAAVLHEKKIPFEMIAVDMASGEHKSAAYTAKQPFGQIPYIVGLIYLHTSPGLTDSTYQDDDGFILYESRAISRYLEERYPRQGTQLIPSGVEAKALFEQAASIEYTNFAPFAIQVVDEMIFKPLFLAHTPDKALFDTLIAGLSAKLDAYEVILGKQKYLGGNDVSLADLFHLAYGGMLSAAGSNIMTTKGPNVERWFNDISTRPSWFAVKDTISSVTSY
ncbi:glutathione S-transferase [Mycena crocata]|nr:glutathione S-transferase [Mycena crocata]